MSSIMNYIRTTGHPPKFFIEWAPNPDPLYHASSESPLEMPIYPPLPEASIPVDGYMISLDHLIGGRAKRKFRDVANKYGLHNVLKYDGVIMLDSGGYQNKNRDPVEVLELQSKFGPDYVVHMDALGNYKKTIRNALITRHHEESFGFKIYYAIQGRTLTEYTKCTKKLLEMGCERFAVGNLAHLAYLRRIEEIERIVLAIKKIIKDKYLHLLGISNPRLILRLKNFISSFDSSTGVRNATRLREVFTWDGNQMGYFRKLDKKPNGFNCDCPICRTFDIFENEYNYPRGTGERRKIRFSRAIHNTFILWKAINSRN